jgi:hypothetical protein
MIEFLIGLTIFLYFACGFALCAIFHLDCDMQQKEEPTHFTSFILIVFWPLIIVGVLCKTVWSKR